MTGSPLRDDVAGVRLLARVLDEAIRIPGTSVRVGLDPVLGLIPGAGDVAGGVLSVVVLLRAARLGVPQSVLARMASNIAIDAAVGTVPLLGDLFDAGWKANIRNVRLLESHLEAPGETRAASRLVVAALAGGALLAVVGAGVLVYWLVRALASAAS